MYFDLFYTASYFSRSGASFSWATSDDLITWSTPQKIDILHGMPANETKMGETNHARVASSWES